MDTLEIIKEHKLIAVIRNAKEEDIVPIAKALNAGGVKVLEITMETPNVLSLIERVSDVLNGEMVVGAGTVLDPETARAAILAGAQFVFSPTVNIETIRMTKRYGVVSIPGAMTPTEILSAYENGADIVKVFPANVLGAGFIKDIKGPLPHIPLMPTGGINLDNVKEYLNNGAIAVGLGSSLFNVKHKDNEEYLMGLTRRAQQFVNVISD